MKYWKNLLATTFYGYFKVVLSLEKFLFAFVLPRGQFQILGFENFHSPLCTGGCKKIVYMPEILVSCHALRWPVRFFGDQRFSFAVIYLVRTLFVTLYFYQDRRSCPRGSCYLMFAGPRFIHSKSRGTILFLRPNYDATMLQKLQTSRLNRRGFTEPSYRNES